MGSFFSFYICQKSSACLSSLLLLENSKSYLVGFAIAPSLTFVKVFIVIYYCFIVLATFYLYVINACTHCMSHKKFLLYSFLFSTHFGWLCIKIPLADIDSTSQLPN